MKTTTVVIAAAAIIVLGACALGIFALAAFFPTVATLSAVQNAGPVQTESRDVSNFTAVNFAAVGDLTITQGDSESLTIQAEDRILRQLKTEVKDGTLTIRTQQESINSLNTVKGIYYTLTVKRLDALTLSGAGNVHATNIKTDRLAVTLSGAGTCEMAGEVGQQSIVLSGAGRYNGGNLKSQSTQAIVSGIGSATVWATDSLSANLSSVGSIQYYGSPQVSKNITGLGSVVSMGNK